MEITTVNPATEEPLVTYPVMSREEAITVAAGARTAFPAWRDTPGTKK